MGSVADLELEPCPLCGMERHDRRTCEEDQQRRAKLMNSWIGATVQYQSGGDTFAAMIVGVSDIVSNILAGKDAGSRVSLHVFPPNTDGFTIPSVPNSYDLKEGHWSWRHLDRK